MSETLRFTAEDEPLFDVRSFLGRVVYIIDNIIQPDFSVDDPEDLIA